MLRQIPDLPTTLSMLTATPVITSSLPILEESPFRKATALPDLSNVRFGASKDDSVEVSLKSASSNVSEEQLASRQSDGLICSALRTVQTLAKRMKDLQDAMAEQPAGGVVAQGLQQELEALQQEYQSVVNGSSFKRSMEILSGVQSVLSSGGDVNAVARSLSREGWIVGGSIVNLTRMGSIAELQNLSGALSNLSSVDPTATTSADSILSLAQQAMRAFSSPAGTLPELDPAAPQGELRFVSAPKLKQLSFNSASELSVGLRTLDTADIIKAAAAHMDFDPQHALILLAPDEPKSKTEAEEQQSEWQKQEVDKLGLFYGSNAPVAAVVDQPATKRLTW